VALTYTPKGELGQTLPAFQLPTVDNKIFSSTQLKGREVSVILFICAHCPYVQAIEDRFIALAHQGITTGVQFVGICSNDWREHPEDSPENLLIRWRDKNYGFPYLIDEHQKIAKLFGAVCTPDIFVYDRNQVLRYRGRFDDSWKDPRKVKNQELHRAIEALLHGQAPPEPQIPSMGCSIKWSEAP
jgi:peroxiredoxin